MNEASKFSLESIYIKDLSFESPNSPSIFAGHWNPHINFSLNIKTFEFERTNQANPSAAADKIWEVVLAVSVKVDNLAEEAKATPAATPANGEASKATAAFVVEIQQAAVISIKAAALAHTEEILNVNVPAMLFPFVSEQITSMVARGHFPQFILPPIDFANLYQQHLNEQQNKTAK
jgi:preprotein translocase subunit SecB